MYLLKVFNELSVDLLLIAYLPTYLLRISYIIRFKFALDLFCYSILHTPSSDR